MLATEIYTCHQNQKKYYHIISGKAEKKKEKRRIFKTKKIKT